jgi:MFS family permease
VSDARGAVPVARLALIAGVPVSLALATGAHPVIYAPLVVAAAVTYGALFTPAFAVVSEGAEGAGLAQGMAFGLLNAAWAAGAMVGPAVAGAIAALTGDAVPFLLVAGAAVAVFVFLGRSKEIRPQPGTVFR